MLKFQRLESNAILPTRGSLESAGLDLYAIEHVVLLPGDRIGIKTGLAVEIPKGYYGRIAPRSGLALRNGIDVMAGVIDPDYRGEIKCLLVNLGDADFEIKLGDRIAQLLIEKVAMFTPTWGNELTESARSAGGFGSTGI